MVSETTITPKANAAVDITAIALSPFIRLLSERRRRKKAAIITTGIVKTRGFAPRNLRKALPDEENTAAVESAPKPTWESPSPIMEYLFKTRLTPRSAEQSETRAPTRKALCINGYDSIAAI